MAIKNNGSELYTLGIWLVKSGNETVFIEAWKQFAEWTLKNQEGATRATLLQDIENPQRFISFGPWKEKENIEAWRGSPEFQEFLKKAKDLCDEIQPNLLKSIVDVAS